MDVSPLCLVKDSRMTFIKSGRDAQRTRDNLFLIFDENSLMYFTQRKKLLYS